MEHGQRLDSITVYIRVRKSTNLILIFAGKDESRSNVSVTDSTRRGQSERRLKQKAYESSVEAENSCCNHECQS